MMALPDAPTPDAAAATLNVIGNLCSATAIVRNSSTTTTTATGEMGSGEQP